MAATLSQFLRSLASPGSRNLPGFFGFPIAPNKPFLAIIKRWKHATTNSAEKALFQGREADKYAAIQYLDLVTRTDTTLEMLRQQAPHYQKKYYRFLDRQEQTVQRLENQKWTLTEMLLLETRAKDGVRDKLDAAKDRAVELERKATAKIHSLGDLVRTLEEKEANLGLRVVLETMLRRFNDRHFAGQCTDASCQAYIQKLLTDKIIVMTTPPTTPPTYVLRRPSWSKADAIEHYATCPSAILRNVYKDASGNRLVHVTQNDMQMELAQRASFIWKNLHVPHHLLDVRSPVVIKIPFGPGRHPVDTLFYYSACEAAEVQAEIVLEDSPSDVRGPIQNILNSPILE